MSGWKDDERGFSLVELVVAMAIVSLALVGMVQAVRGSLAGVGAAGRMAEAAVVLAGQWAALEREGIAEGYSEGELEGGWRWQCDAVPAADPRLLLVSLRLLWTEGNQERHIDMNALTPAPLEE